MRGILIFVCLSGCVASLFPAVGCMIQTACVDSGTTTLIVPARRLGSVSSLRTEGVCVVESLPSECDEGVTCRDLPSGERAVGLAVTGTKRGKCTVFVDYNDGCASEEITYEFGGPYGNCCEDVCARSKVLEPISANCPD